MLNYLKSEIYRNLRSKSNYYFLFGLSAFVIFINVALGLFARTQIGFPYGTTKYALSSFYSGMAVPFFLCLAVVANIFGQEHKHHTLKNTIAYGISRKKVYLAKLIVTLIYSIICLVIISGAYIVTAYLMLEKSDVIHLYELLNALLACLPLFTLAVAAAHCFSFNFENDRIVSAIWIIVLIAIPQLLALAGRGIESIKEIADWLPWNIIASSAYDETTQMMIMKWSNSQTLLKCLIVGIIGSTFFYILGLELFKRKEIK